MLGRLLRCFVLVSAMFGQVSVTVKAGDRAPDIDAASCSHPNRRSTGQV